MSLEHAREQKSTEQILRSKQKQSEITPIAYDSNSNHLHNPFKTEEMDEIILDISVRQEMLDHSVKIV